MLLLPDKGKQIIIASERMINDTLLRLICRPATAYEAVKQTDLIDMLEEIADLRFGNPPGPRMAGFYSGPLYVDVFSPDPVGNVSYRMARLRQHFHSIWIDHDPATVADGLRTFHAKLAHGCEMAALTRGTISALIDEFVEACR
jgi:hypothetical protein